MLYKLAIIYIRKEAYLLFCTEGLSLLVLEMRFDTILLTHFSIFIKVNLLKLEGCYIKRFGG